MSTEKPDLWFSFVRSHRALIREVDRRLAEAGLPVYAWYDVLWGIESGPEESRRMHELADVLAIERYNLTRLIDRLEREELVTRIRSEEDGRAAFVSVTRQGKALRKKMWGIYEAAVKELFLAEFRPVCVSTRFDGCASTVIDGRLRHRPSPMLRAVGQR